MAETMRLDRFLWFARIARTRSHAQGMAIAGRLRLSGRRVDRASAVVRPGDILTYADTTGVVRVLRIVTLPARRGPPIEARVCYEDLQTSRGVSPDVDVPGRGA